MPDITIEQFLRQPIRQQLQSVPVPNSQQVCEQHLGKQGFQELHGVAAAAAGHLGAAGPTNLVFVPGVMGSCLANESRGGIWWLDVRTREFLNELGLSDDGS